MSDTVISTSDRTPEYTLERCDDINLGQARSGVIKASFNGLLQDAPRCSTAIVNGLSQQLIHQMNLIVPDALVSFDNLNVDLGEAAYAYLQPPAQKALQSAIQDRGVQMVVNSAYRTIAQGAGARLMPGGRLLVEIGPTQGAAVAGLFAAAGLGEIRILQDMDGRDRVVACQATSPQ